MSILDGLILGALQGLTEFIPVSSSGHLVLAQHVLGLKASHAFETLVNLGTFVALLIYFRNRLGDITVRIFKEQDIRLARNVIITALPVGVIGFFMGDLFAHPFLQNSWVVAIMLIAVGLVMILLEKFPMASFVVNPENLSAKRSGFIGAAQVLALIPGTSRSAITMVAGRLSGLTYRQAAEYSFLVSIPVMAGVVVKGFIGQEEQAFIASNFGAWLASNIAAFVCGILAVGFMLRFLHSGTFKIFGYYRIGLAIVVIITLLIAG